MNDYMMGYRDAKNEFTANCELRLQEQKQKIAKKIEEMKVNLRKSLIANSKCKCLQWTDKYANISDVFLNDLLKFLEVKEDDRNEHSKMQSM